MTLPILLNGDCRAAMTAWACAKAETRPNIEVLMSAPPFIGGGHAWGIAEYAAQYEHPVYSRVETDAAYQAEMLSWVASWLVPAYNMIDYHGEAWIFAPWYHLDAILTTARQIRWPVRWAWLKEGEALIALTQRQFTTAQIDKVEAIFCSFPSQRTVPILPDALVAGVMEFVKPGGLIDPFSGDGGIPRIAAAQGRLAIGIERDTARWEKSRRLCGLVAEG